jgi:hypothetical protein
MKTIIVFSGEKTSVSDEHFDFLSQFDWSLASKGYPVRHIGGNQYQRMHDDVLEQSGIVVPVGMDVDHEDRNPLNNQRYNLRVVTRGKNNFNRGIFRNNTSGQTGVKFSEHHNKWQAQIGVNGCRIHLGLFVTYEEAVSARLAAERKHYAKEAVQQMRETVPAEGSV